MGFNSISYGTAPRPRPAENKLVPFKVWGGKGDDAAGLSAKTAGCLERTDFNMLWMYRLLEEVPKLIC